MGLRAQQQKLKALTIAKVESGLLGVLRDTAKEAINLNTDQLFAGETSEGRQLPNYSPASVSVFGKRPGPWQLHDTGDFYRGFFADTSKFPVVFGSKDSKTNLILNKLSDRGARNPEEIFGLNKANRKEYSRSYVQPKTVDYFRDLLSV